MSRFASGVGLIPEQNWELPDLAASPFGTDPTQASIGFVNGGAAGSASPLTWSAASFVRRGQSRRRPQRRPAGCDARSLRRPHPGTTPLTVTSPADNSSVSASPITVTGTTAPGNTVYVAATNTDANSATTVVSAAAPSGSFSIAVPVTGGTNVLNVVAVSPSGGTAHVKRSVFFDFVPGRFSSTWGTRTATTTAPATTPTRPPMPSTRAPSTSSASRSTTPAPT